MTGLAGIIPYILTALAAGYYATRQGKTKSGEDILELVKQKGREDRETLALLKGHEAKRSKELFDMLSSMQSEQRKLGLEDWARAQRQLENSLRTAEDARLRQMAFAGLMEPRNTPDPLEAGLVAMLQRFAR